MTILVVLLVVLAGPAGLSAQALESAEPFKVGTFEIDGAATVALVLRDALIVDIGAANTELELNRTYPRLAMPADMLELIGQYEYGLKYRLYEIVNDLVAENRLSGGARADYVHALEDVKILPPSRFFFHRY